MRRKGWYLIAYDIADPLRLQRVHRVIKKEAMALQQSLFLIEATEKKIDALFDRIARKMSLEEDDLRAYPIIDPGHIWANHPNLFAGLPVVSLASDHRKKHEPESESKNKGWLKRLLKL